MPRPLVSVITPTWQRADLLCEAIENVRAQTYRPLEHVVISDGSDAQTASVAIAALDCANVADPTRRSGQAVLVRYVPLGRNWSTFLPDSFCAAPITVGMLVASADYQMWLADDERMEPDHIESLVSALEAAEVDFAYSRVRMYRPGQNPRDGYEIGHDPPSLGQITNVLYRTELLTRSLYPFGAGRTSDWTCIQRWIMYGASWAFVNRVTLTHRIDH